MCCRHKGEGLEHSGYFVSTKPQLPLSAIEVSSGEIYAIGGGLPASVSVSWILPAPSGWTPVQCFAFKGSGEALVMDCGLAVHRSDVSNGLDAVLAGIAKPRLLASRWEPDAIGNLPWLIDRYGIDEVYSYGGINPLDFFETFEVVAAQSLAATSASLARLRAMVPGDVIEVGDLRIEVLTTSLRLLLTNWFFEHKTKSLFTADAFGFLRNPSGPHPFVANPSAAQLAPEVVRESLRAKFDWLSGAHCETLIADLRKLVRGYPIDRVCPSFGGIIEGRENVQCLIQSTISALGQLEKERRRSALEEFDWNHALSPSAVVAF